MSKRIVLVFGAVALCGIIAAFMQRVAQRAAQPPAAEPADAPLKAAKPSGEPATSESLPHERYAVQEASQAPAVQLAVTPLATARLLVHVVGKLTRAPLEGVSVIATPSESHDQARASKPRVEGQQSQVSGADGQVEFEVPAATDLDLGAFPEKDDAGTAELEVTALKDGEHRTLVLELPDGDDLSFHCVLLAGDTRNPISGARISIAQRTRFVPETPEENLKPDSKSLGNLTSDRDGHAALVLASWRRPYLEIDAADFSRIVVQPIAGHEDRDHALVVLLHRGGSLNVEVVDLANSPQADLTVQVQADAYELEQRESQALIQGTLGHSTWESPTDVQGRCIVSSLPVGVSLQLLVLRGTNVLKGNGEPIVLAPGESRTIRVQLGGGCTVRGTLVDDEKNLPIGKHEIWLMHIDAAQSMPFYKFLGSLVDHKVMTDEQGRFRFEDVAAGRWQIGPAGDTDPWSSPAADALAAPVQSILVTDGSRTLDVTLHTRTGLFIRGHVLDSSGAPAIDVQASAELDGGLGTLMAVTRAGGEFTVGPMMPGQYRLRADPHGSDFGSDVVLANAGDRDVTLQLRLGGTIRGRVADASSAAGRNATIWLAPNGSDAKSREAVFAKDDGSFERTGVRPGVYSLTATTRDDRIAVWDPLESTCRHASLSIL